MIARALDLLAWAGGTLLLGFTIFGVFEAVRRKAVGDG